MYRKSMLALAIAALLVTAGAYAQSATLCAGQNLEVGTITIVENADNTLTVTYSLHQQAIDDGWVITETHLASAADYAGLPQTKTGNPAPGKFEHSESHAGVTSFAYTTAAFCDLTYLAAHAVVEKRIITDGPYYVARYESSNQGTRKDGGTILPERSDPANGFIPGDGKFFSLGFSSESVPEPSIVFSFDCPLVNGPGYDLAIWEITNGTYPPEQVNVYASTDNVNWTSIGFATNGRTAPSSSGLSSTMTTLDLGTLASASYIKIVDATDSSLHRWDADGFDLDGIAALQDCIVVEQNETAWAGACGMENGVEAFGFNGSNWATYLTYAPTCHE
jgi:hypothetical protein